MSAKANHVLKLVLASSAGGGAMKWKGPTPGTIGTEEGKERMTESSMQNLYNHASNMDLNATGHAKSISEGVRPANLLSSVPALNEELGMNTQLGYDRSPSGARRRNEGTPRSSTPRSGTDTPGLARDSPIPGAYLSYLDLEDF